MKLILKLPPQELLKEVLDYDVSTGVFTWKKPTGRRVKVGSVAGADGTRGYRQIRIQNVLYRANRLAWMYSYGEDPGELYVDHIDGDTSNNVLRNLRLVNFSQSCMNRGVMGNNKIGFSGVFWSGERNRWRVHSKINGRVFCIGSFDNLLDAVAARIRFTKENFGEFRRAA